MHRPIHLHTPISTKEQHTNGGEEYALIARQDKAVDVDDIEAADGSAGGGLGDRGRAVILDVVQAAALLRELEGLAALQATPGDTDGPVTGRDDVDVLVAVVDVGEPHATAVAALAHGEHADADVGGGLTESELGTDPHAGVGLPLESEPTAGDWDGVGRDRCGDVDATGKSLGDVGVDGSAEGTGGEESSGEEDLGKHIE